jgi:hypothetical protein
MGSEEIGQFPPADDVGRVDKEEVRGLSTPVRFSDRHSPRSAFRDAVRDAGTSDLQQESLAYLTEQSEARDSRERLILEESTKDDFGSDKRVQK